MQKVLRSVLLPIVVAMGTAVPLLLVLFSDLHNFEEQTLRGHPTDSRLLVVWPWYRGWAKHYIRTELLPWHQFVHYDLNEWHMPAWKYQQCRFPWDPRFGGNSTRPGVDVLVTGGSLGHTPLKYLKAIVRCHKPLILLHLDDEWGKGRMANKRSFAFEKKMYANSRLVVRDYPIQNPNESDYPIHIRAMTSARIRYIPLGWQLGYLRAAESLASLKQKLFPYSRRVYKWSFFGTMKTDRVEMVSTFYQRFPDGTYLPQTGVNHSVVRHVYERSQFVTVGRGAHSLECYRTYEACVVGAVPVVVGSANLVNATYGPHIFKQLPPFVFADSWNAAADIVANMSVAEWQRRSHGCIHWLNATLTDVRSEIFDICGTRDSGLRHSPVFVP